MSQPRFEPPRQGRPTNLESGGTRAVNSPTKNNQSGSAQPPAP
jgi:hypothetical protein